MSFDSEPRLNCVNRPSIVGDLHFLAAAGYRFPTVVADPPWRYTNTASRGAAENHYPTLTVEQICDEPIMRIADDNAHLHLWTTNAFLEDAFTVIRAWGFEYKSCMVWVKPTIGMGNYWRVSHEFLLFAIRGRGSHSVVMMYRAGVRPVARGTVVNRIASAS